MTGRRPTVCRPFQRAALHQPVHRLPGDAQVLSGLPQRDPAGQRLQAQPDMPRLPLAV